MTLCGGGEEPHQARSYYERLKALAIEFNDTDLGLFLTYIVYSRLRVIAIMSLATRTSLQHAIIILSVKDMHVHYSNSIA